MELYEALKSGTSLEELEAAFRAEVKKAQERIAKEKADQEEEKRKNLKLAHQRTEFAKSMLNYIALILDEDPTDFADSTKEIEQKLLELEEDLKKISKIKPKLKKTFDQINSEIGRKKSTYVDPLSKLMSDVNVDDDIIKAFLEGLK